MTEHIHISEKQSKWLREHGGRLPADVLLDQYGDKYVLMTDGFGNMIPVYVPKTINL
jgi:hypothetical protein